MIDEPTPEPRTDCPGCGRVMSKREREQGLCDECESGQREAMFRWNAYCARLKKELDRR